MPRYSSDDGVALLQRRVSILFFVVLIFVIIVLTRLFYLQIVKGGAYRNLSNEISVREEEIVAPRGLITDRNGKVIADNKTQFEIVAVPQYIKDKEKTFKSLSDLLGMPEDELLQSFKKTKKNLPFFPVPLIENASYDAIARLKQYERPDYTPEVPVNLQGIQVRNTSLRYYPYPELFSHVLGYLKEVDANQLEKLSEKHPGRYSMGDYMGASGLEGTYDVELKGMDGVKARVVDARGKEMTDNGDLRAFAEETSYPPTVGNYLVSTLDFEAQEAAEKAIAGRRGSVVAMDPHTGEVLVLYSSPAYDPNRISKNFEKAYWQHINLHPDKILYNRSIQATYPPGSIYKIVTAFAGLDSGKVKLDTTFNCGGGMQFGSRFFKCWNKSGHGVVNFLRGVGQSCDVYFYRVGLLVGVDTIKKYATLLGLGAKTGIDIAFEQPGLIPSSEWKEKKLKSPWMESETLSIAIGQGYDLLTPVQAAMMVSIVANGGYKIKPHLAKILKSPAGKILQEWASTKGEQVIPTSVVKSIQEGMIEVVHGVGTAKKLQESRFKIAGKTGTAQVIGHDSGLGETARTKPHGWFVAFAPYDDPKIAIAVIVENGGGGSVAAAPVAKEVIDAYLNKLMPPEQAAPTYGVLYDEQELHN